jgi:hypothetical protein
MIPGDGVGPELMASVKSVLSAAGAPVDFQEVLARYCSTEFLQKVGWFELQVLIFVLCMDMPQHCYLIFDPVSLT